MRACFDFGLLRAAVFLARRRVTILMLHGVVPSGAGSWSPLWPRVDTEHLDKFLALLSRYFNFVSMDDAVEMLAGNKPQQPYSLVLTFDDGYANNIEHALPILRRHNAPMTIYSVTAAIKERTPMWVDRLDYLIQHQDQPAIELRVGAASQSLDCTSRARMERDYRHFRLRMKDVFADDREMFSEIDKLATRLEAGGGALTSIIGQDPWSRLLTAEEIGAMPDDVTLGSHTVSHYRVEHIDKESLMRELQSSKSELELWRGRECRHFCYPNGDYSAETAACVAAAGYQSAVTTEPGLNRPGDNLFTLRRLAYPSAPTALHSFYRLCVKIVLSRFGRIRSNSLY